MLTIGAGGGSLAWIDEAGALRNGPQSAGANPGPACYGRGNTVPTNTDANVVLGRLGTGWLAAASRSTPTRLPRGGADGVAEQLRARRDEAAEAIIRVANANMADAVRLISISRGYDPRDFALVAFGGAGALHGAAIARELSIPAVIVPPNPGITSAHRLPAGRRAARPRRKLHQPVADADPDAIEAAFRKLENEAVERLAHEGVAADDVVMQRTVDMMYQGQWRSLAVPAPRADRRSCRPGRGVPSTSTSANTISAATTRRSACSASTSRRSGSCPKPNWPASADRGAMPEPAHAPPRLVRRHERHDTPVYWRPDLPAGARFADPPSSNSSIPRPSCRPASTPTVDDWLNIVIRLEA